MSSITRSEAEARLKIVSSHVNGAITETRDGNWKRVIRSVEEALTRINALLPLLDEAAGQFMPPSNPQYSHVAPPAASVNAMGLRPVRQKPVDAAPPAPIARPKPQPVKPQPKRVLVTPIPAPKEALFDLSRMAGQEEYMRTVLTGTAPPLTDAEWEVTELFDSLPQATRDGIVARYRDTKAPVAWRRP